VAARLKITPETVRRWLRTGKLLSEELAEVEPGNEQGATWRT
jgi:hypothetical protein